MKRQPKTIGQLLRMLASYVAHSEHCAAKPLVACSCEANQVLMAAKRWCESTGEKAGTIDGRLADPFVARRKEKGE